MKVPSPEDALKLVNWVTNRAVEGASPLCSARDLALQYQIDTSYPDNEERIESLINWETSKNFTSGFITGLGGLMTMPVSVPSAFGASWVIQARMAAAIAVLGGHDIASDKIRTFVVLCLAGDAAKDVLKDVGIKVGQEFTKAAFNKIPGKLFIEINKKVGFRLVTKAGQKGAINLMKMVPLAGGLVGGAFDAGACRVVGKQAKRLFFPQGTTSGDGTPAT